MKMTDIRAIARKNGIKPGKLNKTALIQTIQETEGNNVCFATIIEASDCDQEACLWRSDCFTTAKKNKAA